MKVVSSGTANLKTEALDFSLRPNPREGSGIAAGKLVKLMQVQGTLADPKIGIDELEAAKTALSVRAGVAAAEQSLRDRPREGASTGKGWGHPYDDSAGWEGGLEE